MTHQCGIYKIINRVNGHFYIGGTNNLKKRWQDHKKLLRRNKHHNRHLQNAWNKYKEKSFKYRPILYCNEDKITVCEQKLLNKYYGSQKCYNLSKDAECPMRGLFGKQNPLYGRKKSKAFKKMISHLLKGRQLTKQHKLRISKNHHNVNGKNNPFHGKRHKASSKKLISKNHANFKGENHGAAKFTDKQVIKIKQMLKDGYTCTELGKRYKVSDCTIRDIYKNRRWTHI